MPYYCTVPRCTSMAGKAKNVSFHQFPRDEDLAKLWNKILKRGKPYTKYSKVCSLHFTPDDYTITSGQKNKGQWRTLRKDAVPSRNLPTDSPAPYHRRSSSWTPPPTVIDARMHQQMAQAIYVQTMLAMQAASISALNNEQSSSDEPEPTTTYTPTNTNTYTQNTNTKDTHTFKCGQCSKCFKDPDVFLLHQRSHTKNIENASTEEMLKANPILANLLNSNGPQTSLRQETGVFDVKNVKSIENQIMAALTANMENYLRNLSTIMTNNTVKNENFDNDQNSDNETYDNSQNFDNCQNSDNEGFDNGQNIDNKNFDKDGFGNGQDFDNQNSQNSDNDHNFDNVDSKRDLMSNCDNQDLYDSNLVIDEDNS